MKRRQLLLGATAAVLAARAEATTASGDASLAAAAERSILHGVIYGVDDVFPRPSELDRLGDARHRRSFVEDVIAGAGSLRAPKYPIEQIAVRKPRGDEDRICSLLAPVDATVYLARVLPAARLIEANRLPRSSGEVHSYRFVATHGAELFDVDSGFSSFMRSQRRKSRGLGAMAICDIRQFYPSLSHQWLWRSLARMGVSDQCIEPIASMLSHWGSDAGLPVGQQASRILAEAALAPIDRAMAAAGMSFDRFVDDYRIYGETPREVETAVDFLRRHLSLAGLELNETKTVIGARSDILAERVPSAPSEAMATRNRRGVAQLMQRTGARAEDLADLETVPSAAGTRHWLYAFALGGSGETAATLKEVLQRHPQHVSYAAALFERVTDEERLSAIGSVAGELVALDTLPGYSRIQLTALLAGTQTYGRDSILRFMTSPDQKSGGAEFRQGLDALSRLGGVRPQQLADTGALDKWSSDRLSMLTA